MDKKTLAKYMDHTILAATATDSQVEQICREALQIGTASVCINPCHIKQTAEILKGSSVKVCTVVGFPLGANTSEAKAAETADAVKKGAEEIDMVINVGALKSGETLRVYDDIKAVVTAADGRLVKVIIETCYLTDDEKVAACQLAEKAGADFVKTSTGFGTGGATVADVALMKKTVGDRLKVKASGGIRTLADAEAMIAAGADRLGLSASVSILDELEK